jgi:methionyl aminopeptidase
VNAKFTYNRIAMSNLEFARAQARDTKIKLHGPDAFAGNGEGGRLVPRSSISSCDEVKPALPPRRSTTSCLRFAMAHGAVPCPAQLSRLPEIDLHLAQSCGLPRHPGPRALKRAISSISTSRSSSTAGTAIRAACMVWQDPRAAERLLEVTYNALMRGVAAVKPAPPPAISVRRFRPMPKASAAAWCAIFCGHGLVRVFHDRPNILHYGEPGEGCRSSPACCSPSSR